MEEQKPVKGTTPIPHLLSYWIGYVDALRRHTIPQEGVLEYYEEILQHALEVEHATHQRRD